MVAVETAITLKSVQKIVWQIVEHFSPQKVILFGSYADGTPTEDSDVDLLVVMEVDGQLIHAAAQIAATVDHPFPLDIVVSTPSQLKASFDRKGNFATEVLTRGIVLYEA